LASSGVAVTAHAAEASATRAYMEAVLARLPANATKALRSIDGPARQLLAVRAYVRAGESLESRWSWSTGEILQYEQSSEYREALAHLERIAQRFAAANPGYTLYVNTQVRSLETQLDRWNENDSVRDAAKALQEAAARELSNKSYPRNPGAAARERFAKFLKEWLSPRAVNLAAPGLSPHGQARAFDFQVQHGDVIVAGTEAGDVTAAWDAQGWTHKLSAAIAAESDRFQGPLAAPREPWHYEYHP